MPSVEQGAPTTPSLPGRGRVSGRKRGAATIMAMPIGTLMKNPTRQENTLVKIPPSTRPKPAPMPGTAP
jgi:hypothetical protein